MAQRTLSRDLDKIIIRLPDGLRDQLHAVAKSAGRSLNAEVVARLSEPAPAQQSLRDWFAGQALAGMIGHNGGNKTPYADDPPWVVAEAAYALADAMIAGRQKGGA